MVYKHITYVGILKKNIQSIILLTKYTDQINIEGFSERFVNGIVPKKTTVREIVSQFVSREIVFQFVSREIYWNLISERLFV